MVVAIEVDGRSVQVATGVSVLRACWEAGAYVPALCAHPDLVGCSAGCGPGSRRSADSGTAPGSAGILPAPTGSGTILAEGPPLGIWQEAAASNQASLADGCCGLCLVECSDREEPVLACTLPVADGMRIRTRGARLEEIRRKRLSAVLEFHPHVCLTCPQRDGCDRTDCTFGLVPAERCCERFGRCEVQQVADFIGIAPDTPRYRPAGLPSWTGDSVLRMELDRCVGCQRCVEACNGRMGHGALMAHPVSNRLLAAPRAGATGLFRDSGCKFCGACVEVCPAGAILPQGPNGSRWLATVRAKLGLTAPPAPPRKTLAFDRPTVEAVPELSGVYRLFDSAGRVTLIEGAVALRQALLGELEGREGVAAFDFEEAPMFTQRATELLAMHLKEHGKLPTGNDLDDDLF